MRAVITGGFGFIGATIAAQLIKDGFEVVLVDNSDRGSLDLIKMLHPEISKCSIFERDIRDKQALDGIFMEDDIVIHAAAIAGIDATAADTLKTLEVNVLGTFNVLQLASEARVRKVIEFSTSEIFGEKAFNVDEHSQPVPGSVGEARWVYGASKLIGEHFAKAVSDSSGIPVVTVRPFNCYGPGQTGEGAMSVFIRKARRGDPLYIFGDGTQIRAWIFIADLVDALLAIIKKDIKGYSSFNIGNPRAVTTVYALAKQIVSVIGSSSTIEFRPALSADIGIRIPNVSKMSEELGIDAEVDIEQGIAETNVWYDEFESYLSPLPEMFE